MSWIASLKQPGHITESIIHSNKAMDALKEGISNVEASRYLSDALNKIQTEWVLQQNEPDLIGREIKAFQTSYHESRHLTAAWL